VTSASSPGFLVISLDFELYWGVRDKRRLDEYRANLEGVWRAVPALLRVFQQFGVHATWATVGLVFCTGADDALRSLPCVLPVYEDPNLSPYHDSASWRDSSHARCRFAPDLIDRVAAGTGQELATHTFSHYYCLERGQDQASFEADLAAAQAVAARRGTELKSIVFPRNQINAAYLPSCRSAGIESYRGALAHPMYVPRQGARQSPVVRAQRLLDSYVPISGDRSYPLAALGETAPFNVAASAFLRPHDRAFTLLNERRVQRLCGELSRAAQRGHVFHLWWHPHNFGQNLQENLHYLCRVLAHFSTLQDRYGMRSVNMNELSTEHRQSSRAA
jgi:peptidoglycan/xylan/chitin deacetylase (PgdA/CDA1 family)